MTTPTDKRWLEINPELLQRMAVLAVGAINTLLVAGFDDEGPGCCADCCHPCAVLRDMLDDGSLDALLGFHAPTHHLGYNWWVVPQYEQDIRKGHVDGDLLHSMWRCGSQPPCDTDTEEVPGGPITA